MAVKFSIIIPVYNVADGLQRAVSSVTAQSFPDLEVILVDDGSTDGSGLLCDQIAANDSRVYALHQDNQGVVVARKNGFAAASGDWVLFLDGDDEQMPGLLTWVSAVIAEHNPDMVQFGFVMGTEGGQLEDHHLLLPEGLYLVADLINRSKKTPLEVTEMCLWNKAYRRAICQQAFEDVGDVRIKHSEDGLFAFAAYLHSRTFYYGRQAGVKYYLRAGSAVHKFNVDLAAEKVIFVDRIVTLFEQSDYYIPELALSMRAFHSYESVSFIFYRMLQWSGSVRQVLELIRSLTTTRLMAIAEKEPTNPRRRIMFFLLRHPITFVFFRFLSKIKRII